MKPRYPEAIEYRAETYLAMGRIDDMRSAYKRLLSLDEATAAKMVEAIRTFIANPPENYPETTLSTLAAWVEERSTLARVTGSEGSRDNW